MRSVALGFLVFASFMVVLGGCSGTAAFSHSPPTTLLNQPSAATVIVHLKAGTSASQALGVQKDLLYPTKHINGWDGIGMSSSGWNALSPQIVRVDLTSWDTVAEVDRLLLVIRKTPHVEDVTVQFG